MRIIRFPHPDDAPDVPTPPEVEAALHGDAVGPSAEYWRELRADVRALAPPLPPALEQRLRERIEQRASAGWQRTPGRARIRRALARITDVLGSRGYATALAVLVPVAVAAIVAVALVDPGAAPQTRFAKSAGRATSNFSGAAGSSSSAKAKGLGAPASAPVASQALAPQSADAVGPAQRVQQRGASITLAAKPEEVQSVADQVAQLAAREGGFVQSSHVQVQAGRPGEANLQLSLPSERLSASLASLGRIASTRAESQSLQDISDVYDAAKRKLADAVAERQALLRALARASAQGQIESIRARLALVGGAITRDRDAFQSVSRRGSSSTVEVTVLGNANAGGGGLTLSRGLHDAGDVLRGALAALLIVLAVLVPLAVLLAVSLGAWRVTRRRLRERALS
ncbi:MAG TPA: DUF4349 domain-containing protein [Solirubrobacteraceae bacterium]|jgi:hypothetical protein